MGFDIMVTANEANRTILNRGKECDDGMGKELVKGLGDAQIKIEDEELCRIFFKTERIVFGVSEIGAGKTSILDAGHPDAGEVF